MTFDGTPPSLVVHRNELEVRQTWRDLQDICEPFLEYVERQKAAHRRLEGVSLTSFIEGIHAAVRQRFDVVTTKASAPVHLRGSIRMGMAHEIFAVKPSPFKIPDEGDCFSLACIHLFASPERVRLQVYDTPNVWGAHFAERWVERGNPGERNPLLHTAKALMRAAPFIAAARVACGRSGATDFALPFGKGLLLGSFRNMRNILPGNLEQVLFDYGRADYPFGERSVAMSPTKLNFDYRDPFAIPIVKTYISSDMLDARRTSLRDQLVEVENRFSDVIAKGMNQAFRAVSVIDPIGRLVPDLNLAAALEDVYDAPEFDWQFGRNFDGERLQTEAPMFRMA